MSWFQKACRNLGLTIHHTVKPVKDYNKTVISKTVEEQQIDATTTLRRTTIEEVEITPRKPAPGTRSGGASNRDPNQNPD